MASSRSINIATIDIFLGAMISMTIIFYVVAKSEASPIPARTIPQKVILDVETDPNTIFEIQFDYDDEEVAQTRRFRFHTLGAGTNRCQRRSIGSLCAVTLEQVEREHYSRILPYGNVDNIQIRIAGFKREPTGYPASSTLGSVNLLGESGLKLVCSAERSVAVGEIVELGDCRGDAQR